MDPSNTRASGMDYRRIRFSDTLGLRYCWGWEIISKFCRDDHLQALTTTYSVAYIYFDYKERVRQRPIDVLASLVKQLTRRIPHLPAEIEALYDEHELDPEEKAPSFEELYASLLTASRSFPRIFFILDVLDECDQESQRKELLPLFHRMAEDGISLFITNRQYPEDIQESFRCVAKMELSAKKEDIRAYIQGKIDKNPRAKRLVRQARCEDRIISELIDCSQGMFLIVHFHIDYLCRQPTANHMLVELGKLRRLVTAGRPMDPTYDMAMKILYNQPRNCADLAVKILSWLVKAQRTLTVDELREAVSIEPNRYELDEFDLPDRATLLDVCAGLVTIDEHSHTIGLAHYTVQEYLLRKSIIPEDADFQLAIACTTFLSFEIFDQGACGSESTLSGRLKLHPFLKYAADQLSYHLRSCDEHLTINHFLRFLGSQGNISSYLQALCFGKGNPCTYPKDQLPLHVASAVGHKAAVQVLLEKGADLAAPDRYGRTPSYLAISRGHEAIVRLFVERGADISVPITDGLTALHKAASKGHITVINLLLDKVPVIDISVEDNYGRTALHWAASRGHGEVVRLLLDNGADLSARENNGWTPLHMAAYRGHESVVHLLIQRGADLSVVDGDGWTVLRRLASRGNEASCIARMLLENGADISARDRSGWTTLHAAAFGGHETLVKLLLDKDADSSELDNYGITALYKAVSQGHEAVRMLLESNATDSLSHRTMRGRTVLHAAATVGDVKIVQLLLDKGADFSISDNIGLTALSIAAREGHLSVVQLLLDRGDDLSTRNKYDWTPLHQAASQGCHEVIKLLIEKGSDILAPESHGCTALHEASFGGHEKAVKLLLENGADSSVVDSSGFTPLHMAASQGHEAIVRILLDYGASVLIRCRRRRTALHTATYRGYKNIVQLILEKGDDLSESPRLLLSFVDKYGRRVLHSAASRGHHKIVRLLIDYGADISVSDKNGWTPLHFAAFRGHKRVVELLLTKGADISALDKGGGTALNYAAFRGHEAVVRLLLDEEAGLPASDGDVLAVIQGAISKGVEYREGGGSTPGSNIRTPVIKPGGPRLRSTPEPLVVFGEQSYTFKGDKSCRLLMLIREPDVA